METKAILHRYLGLARDGVLWKLDGLSEYDARRPLTPTATNLLGLVKHLAYLELEYFGVTFGRSHDEIVPWVDREQEPNEDMFATPEETRDDIVALYRRATAFADTTIAELSLDAPGTVPWWPDDINPVTLHWIMVHMIAETNRHLGHADILREGLDGAAGFRPNGTSLPDEDDAWWQAQVDRLEAIARGASTDA